MPFRSGVVRAGRSTWPALIAIGAISTMAATPGAGHGQADRARPGARAAADRDTDRDGLPDRVEIRRYHTNPLKRDTDGDRYGDHAELRAGTNPRSRLSYPGFPDKHNTGVPPGTTLTAYTGPSTVSIPNTVIVAKTVGCITVRAPGVVIRNSRISCRGDAVFVDDRSFGDGATPLLVESSEISCQDEPGSSGIGEADFVARRVEITHCENGFDANQNIQVEDSFIHDLWNGESSHLDGMQLAGGHWNGSAFVCCALNITLRHNTIYAMGDGDTSIGNSAIISNPAGDANILIEKNLLGGGTYDLYCPGWNGDGGQATVYRIIDNQFSTKFRPKVGIYGISLGCSDETQSGNAIHETGRPLRLR